jgi:hypothetical protein
MSACPTINTQTISTQSNPEIEKMIQAYQQGLTPISLNPYTIAQKVKTSYW